MQIQRGDIFDADLPGAGTHPVVVITRNVAIPVLSSVSTVLITSTVRGHLAEVLVGREQGLDHECAINCDNVFTISKRRLGRSRGSLGPEKSRELDDALKVALQLD